MTDERFRLTDDGTLDTVLECSECGEQLRYNFCEVDDDGVTLPENAYDDFVAWAIQDAEDTNECSTQMTGGNTMTDEQRTVVLVYQAGIANIFDVTGGERKRLLQHAFTVCEWFARGMGAAGCVVRSMHCNQAGDIANAEWSDNLEDAPFREFMNPVNEGGDLR